jgi:retron-type reverse transcriptase
LSYWLVRRNLCAALQRTSFYLLPYELERQEANRGGAQMTLSTGAIDWATQYVYDHADGDLFPRLAEMSAIVGVKADLSAAIAGKPLTQFSPGAHRRFIVPKDEISYRQATQLDPQDSIILSAIAYEFGQGIEDRRQAKDKVFSYRFSPTTQHGLYASQGGWNDFWTKAARLSAKFDTILYCDISDFYNQISHHAVENQLIASGLPNQAIRWIVALLESTTAGVSRGLPIGPHAAHLVAEASLIPVDNSFATSGHEFLRYADDIVVFSKSNLDAKRALARLANILDKQQRLTLQRHKTRFFTVPEFKGYCAKMIEDRPINSEEDNVLNLVRKYAKGNPYKTISYSEITPSDWLLLSETLLRKIIEEYLGQGEIDFIRLRWLYRRLAQIGHPGAIDVTLDHIDRLAPCFASICTYLASVQSIDANRWLSVGARLLGLLDRDDIRESEYFRLSILSLFSRIPSINHFTNLAGQFAGSDLYAKREILLAAKAAGAIDWIRELKEDFGSMDPWMKKAFLFCCKDFPEDERKYFVNRWTFERPFDSTLAKWAKSK